MDGKSTERLIVETMNLYKDVAELLGSFLSDGQVKKVTKEHFEHKNRKFDYGFNIFDIVSNLYYRENFHSDIIAAFLNPKEKHNEGNLFLNIFIEFLNQIEPKLAINYLDFQNSEVIKEFFIKNEEDKGRIDILIKCEPSKKIILIENKINNAPDQNNQLPKYTKYFVDNGYHIEAIIYLNLNHREKPCKLTWTKNEDIIKEIEAKLTIVEAYNDKKKNDLLNGWLIPCQVQSKNFDSVSILKQYSKLIQKLGYQNMNKLIMDKFYSIIQDKEEYETALLIKEMMNDLPKYLYNRIQQRYELNHIPFQKLYIWNDSVIGFTDFMYKDAQLILDIKILPKLNLSIEFFDRHEENGKHKKDIAEKVLIELDYLHLYNCSSKNRFIYSISIILTLLN